MTEARAARVLPSRQADLPLQVGDGFRLENPDGGFGGPFDRDPGQALGDVVASYLSRRAGRAGHIPDAVLSAPPDAPVRPAPAADRF
jgi:hypothetical protein